jgi:polyphosphate:AMP phosphotransferase
MFKSAEIGRKVEKQDYEAQVPELREELLNLQQELRKTSCFVILVLSGDDRIGISDTLSILHQWMDPRFLETIMLDNPEDGEDENPEFWRFWRNLPPRGHIGIIFGSWYRKAIRRAVKNPEKTNALENALSRINFFEKELVDDGALILKFWLHLKKDEMEKRMRQLEKDPRARRLSMKEEQRILRLYDKGQAVIQRVLSVTSTGWSPWRVVEGYDPRYRNLVVGETVREELAKRVHCGEPAPVKISLPPRPKRKLEGKTILSRLDLTSALPRAKYEKLKEKYQGKINDLTYRAAQKNVSSILVFEGWDAAGKGGIIIRVTNAMDARHFRVIPIAAPTDEERAHHYLWRFWRHLPRAGRVTIFDRSWYGRVLVERVQKLATEDEWRRAYHEINDFEDQLCRHGILVLKFWLHIDKAEQLKRFREREDTPYKQYKITSEDWRNRKHWSDYETAVNEMVQRTSTDYAPWTLVEANDKYFARIKVLKTFCDALEKRL